MQCRPRANAAFDPDLSAVPFDDLFDDDETQADAFVMARGRTVDLMKTIEQLWNSFGRNAAAFIDNVEPPARVGGRDGRSNFSALR